MKWVTKVINGISRVIALLSVVTWVVGLLQVVVDYMKKSPPPKFNIKEETDDKKESSI